MKLLIDDISAETKGLSFAEPPEAVNRLLAEGPVQEYRLEGPMSVTVSYYRSGMELFFQGELDARVMAACARCAEEFSAPAHRSFRFVLAPGAAGDRAHTDLRAEDLEFSLYHGEEVDLSPLIREQVLLALSERPLCTDKCRGLCPMCGTNLNDSSCDCRAPISDPRLEILRSVKAQRPSR